ncbi:hypothetical protein ACFY93_20415 [Streptomyces sp. NPDC008313]|uniref:effector-associated constant component EACC1 n=1 Tax=Streptomyces sp. NPDC008313 TaxID=3364826 RepID=UPI0036E6FC14
MTQQVLLHIEGADSYETAEITGQLRDEILGLDVEAVDRGTSGEPPEGSKGDASQLGELVVLLAGSGIIPMLVQLVREWTSRRNKTKVTITYGNRRLEIEDVETERQQEAVAAFLRNLSE